MFAYSNAHLGRVPLDPQALRFFEAAAASDSLEVEYLSSLISLAMQSVETLMLIVAPLWDSSARLKYFIRYKSLDVIGGSSSRSLAISSKCK